MRYPLLAGVVVLAALALVPPYAPAGDPCPDVGVPAAACRLEALAPDECASDELNGNFYTGQAVLFPIRARASACPNDQSMVATVDQAGGSCNGCHGGTNQIHLP